MLKEVSMTLDTLDKTMEKLPNAAKKELIDFAEFLKQKYSRERIHKKLKLDWAGKLERYKDKLNDPVMLQHEITDLWGGLNVPR